VDKSLIINNLNLEDINVIICGYEKCVPGHFFGPAIRSYYLFHYILSGEGTFEANDKTYNLKAGQGFLICPQHTTFYKADEENPWEYIWIGFEGKRAYEFIKRANLTQDMPIFSLESNSIAHNNFIILNDYIKKDETNELYLTGCIYNILGGLTQGNFNEKLLSRPQVYINRAVNYINANYHLPVTVESVSMFLGIERKYFCSIFKKYMGITPIQYIMKIKATKACEMLKNTSSSVGDIARSVGYDDIFSFSRMFTKFMKISPSKYRKL